MSFLVRVLRRHEELRGCKVVVVTGRLDLEEQILHSLGTTGETPRRASPLWTPEGTLQMTRQIWCWSPSRSPATRMLKTTLMRLKAMLLRVDQPVVVHVSGGDDLLSRRRARLIGLDVV